MNHTELERELPFYVNGTLAPEIVARIEREAPGCERCASELDELRALRDALVASEAAATAPPANLYAEVISAIDAQSERRAAKPPRPAAAFDWLRRHALVGYSFAATAALAALLFLHPSGGSVGDVSPADSFANRATDLAAPAAAPAPESAAVAPRMNLLKTAETAAKPETPGLLGRQLARTGSIGLIVGDVPSAIARVERLVTAQFGAVTGLDDEAPSSPGGIHTAKVTVSVPDDRFASTLDALAALGGVTARSVSTEDLTDSIVDGDARLRNLRREETDLLRIMDRSGRVSDILSVEQQLETTRESIERLDAEQKSMRNRVAYATLTVDLSDEKATPVAAAGPGAHLTDAWSAALRAVVGFTLAILSALLYVLAFAPYVAALAAIVYVVRRRSAARR